MRLATVFPTACVSNNLVASMAWPSDEVDFGIKLVNQTLPFIYFMFGTKRRVTVPWQRLLWCTKKYAKYSPEILQVTSDLKRSKNSLRNYTINKTQNKTSSSGGSMKGEKRMLRKICSDHKFTCDHYLFVGQVLEYIELERANWREFYFYIKSQERESK